MRRMSPAQQASLFLVTGARRGLGTVTKTASTGSGSSRSTSSRSRMSSADQNRLATTIVGGITDVTSSIASAVAESRGARRAAAEVPVEDLGPISGEVSVSTPWGKIAIGTGAALLIVGGLVFFLTRKPAPAQAPMAKAA